MPMYIKTLLKENSFIPVPIVLTEKELFKTSLISSIEDGYV